MGKRVGTSMDSRDRGGCDVKPGSRRLVGKARHLLGDLLCPVLFVTGFYRVIRFLRDVFGGTRSLTIIAYHKANNEFKKGNYIRPHVKAISVNTFARQMKHLSKRQNVLPLEEAVLAIRKGERLPRNAVCITFDDGYRDNYANALPVLWSYGLPATFFLTTAFVGSRQPSWYVTLSAYLRFSSRRELIVESLATWLQRLARAGRTVLGVCDPQLDSAPTRVVLRSMLKALDPIQMEEIIQRCMPQSEKPWVSLPLATARDRARAREFLAGQLRSRPWYEQDVLLDVLKVLLGLKGSIYVPFGEMMTWDMVREMARDGMNFGAHTCTHPILTRIPRSVAVKEAITSKHRLESALGKPANLFCYPNGRITDFNEELAQELKKAGFVAACSMVPGTNMCRSDLFALRRIGPDENLARFAMKATGILK